MTLNTIYSPLAARAATLTGYNSVDIPDWFVACLTAVLDQKLATLEHVEHLIKTENKTELAYLIGHAGNFLEDVAKEKLDEASAK